MNRLKNFWLAASAVLIAHWARANTIFPTAPGASWEYEIAESSAAGAQSGIITLAIVGDEQIDGQDAFTLETHRDDILQKTELIAVDERGIVCHRRSLANGKTVSFEPPQRLIPAELKLGAKWELDGEVAGAEMHQQFTIAAEEEVVVPAGTFHAYRFDCEDPWPIAIAIRRWFFPGIGFVKDITTTRGPTGRLLSRVTIVLKKFSPFAVPLPNDSPTPAPLPSAAPSPKITLAVAKGREGEPATEFRSDAPNIFVRWLGEHLPIGGDVRVAWIAEDVGDVAPANFIVDAMETTVSAPESGAQFTLSRPKDGWAAGKYRVELYLDDKLMESVSVTISD